MSYIKMSPLAGALQMLGASRTVILGTVLFLVILAGLLSLLAAVADWVWAVLNATH
jgi:hypothetical protein